MAGVLDHDTARVVIKREIEDSPESPEHAEVQDSPQSQADANGSQKQTKVWSEDEIRSLIELQKGYIQKMKDGNYSKKQLMEDVAQELNLIGYDATPENVRYKMKYLRARYKGAVEYNSKHVEKKAIPFQEELSELFSMEGYEDPEPLCKEINCNGTSEVSFRSGGSERLNKRAKSIPASHVDLRAVVTTKKKRNSAVTKGSKGLRVNLKKKGKRKPNSQVQPLFQCGLCMNKFRTSYDMHDHRCKSPPKTNNVNSVKKKQSPVSANSAQVFHWNSLITMQFLDLLKEYQESHKNSNFRKGNIWENMSALMKRLGYKIHPKVLAKKWSILSSTFEKTLSYNMTHKDKKKCAFFKRLMELHNHPSSFDCFKQKSSPAKRTVEVSPFSFSQRPAISSSKASSTPNSSTPKIKEEKTKQSNPPDLITVLDNCWTEYKEMERIKQQQENQRHNEIMEMLSYLIDSKH